MIVLQPMPGELISAWAPVVEAAATTTLAVFGVAVFFQLRMAKQSLEAAQESISITKHDIHTRLFREAASRAAELSEEFGTKYMPDFFAFENSLTAKGVAIQEWRLSDSQFRPQSFRDWDAAVQWMRDLANDFSGATTLANRMEGFALYFANGVADESIAYPAISAVFCSLARKLAPLITHLRTGDGGVPSGSFENTRKLYEVWSNRATKAVLDAQQRALGAASDAIPNLTLPTIGSEQSKP